MDNFNVTELATETQRNLQKLDQNPMLTNDSSKIQIDKSKKESSSLDGIKSNGTSIEQENEKVQE